MVETSEEMGGHEKEKRRAGIVRGNMRTEESRKGEEDGDRKQRRDWRWCRVDIG